MGIESTLTATLVDHMGEDLTVVNAARVSVGSFGDMMGLKDIGLLNYLMKNKHASPFEHCSATFLIDAPIFVAREWMRHRTQSFNEVSGRYKELEGRFYLPDFNRPLQQVGKPGAYTFMPGDGLQCGTVADSFDKVYGEAWAKYQNMLTAGVAKEVARMVLPVGTYTQWYATSNLRNWLNFLALRTDDNAMFEIRQLAFSVEAGLYDLFPHTMDVWEDNGRNAL